MHRNQGRAQGQRLVADGRAARRKLDARAPVFVLFALVLVGVLTLINDLFEILPRLMGHLVDFVLEFLFSGSSPK